MGDKANISWTDATWNPIQARNIVTGKTGWHCEHVTEACRNCYAERMNVKAGASGGTGFAYKPGHVGKDVELFMTEKRLRIPLGWRKPRRIFVCSMTDMFADFVTYEMLDSVFGVMGMATQHTFQILTKRPARMRAYIMAKYVRGIGPLPNVWLGTSICDQGDADKFVPELLATPAAVRFLSCEPLLGPIDLYHGDPDPRLGGHKATKTFLGDWWEPGDYQKGPARHGVDWVIAGGESGPSARPMHPDWARSLRDQCAAADVPFHFKQHGEFLDGVRVGVKKAGRLMDGRTHDDCPAI